MKKNIIAFCCCLFSFCLSAQTSYPFFNNMKGERKIVADTVITRVAPSTGAAFDDTLYFANPVEILMTVPYTEVRNSMVSPWLKVMYQKGKFKKIGFVSAIDIALNNKLIYKNYEFVWGVVANNKKDFVSDFEQTIVNNYRCKLIAMKDGKRVAESKFEFEINDSIKIDSLSSNIISKVKLSNVLCAIELEIIKIANNSNYISRSSFVLCKTNDLTKLPITDYKNPFTGVGLDDNVFEQIDYSKKNTFDIIKIDSKCIPDRKPRKFKWQNCSYTLIK